MVFWIIQGQDKFNKVEIFVFKVKDLGFLYVSINYIVYNCRIEIIEVKCKVNLEDY